MWKVFGRRTLATQIVTICGLFLVPLAIAMVLITEGYNKEIRFTSLELQGNQFQRPLVKLLHWIPQRAHPSDAASDPATDAGVAPAIEAALSELEAMNRTHGQALQFTDDGLAKRKREHYRVEKLREEWESIQQGREAQPRYDHLIEDVRAMITHAGDTSN